MCRADLQLIGDIQTMIERLVTAAEDVRWEVPVPPEVAEAGVQVEGLEPTAAERLAMELERLHGVGAGGQARWEGRAGWCFARGRGRTLGLCSAPSIAVCCGMWRQVVDTMGATHQHVHAKVVEATGIMDENLSDQERCGGLLQCPSEPGESAGEHGDGGGGAARRRFDYLYNRIQ